MNNYQSAKPNNIPSNRPLGGGYNPRGPLNNRAEEPLPIVTGQGRVSTIQSEQTTFKLNQVEYCGKTYSVKYLGIVDGTMGILSRKMAL